MKQPIYSLYPFLLSCFLPLSLFSAEIPEKITHNVKTIQIKTLPQVSIIEPHWIQARVVDQMTDDTFLIEDTSGQVILFLSTDEMMEKKITVGDELLIFGKLDVSPIRPEKNEFYAEQIFFPK